jgi:hypothetical protein
MSGPCSVLCWPTQLRFPGGYAEHAPQPVQIAGHGAEGDLGVGTETGRSRSPGLD